MVVWLLTEAVRREATAVHLDQSADGLRIRYRVDGAIVPGPSLPRDLGNGGLPATPRGSLARPRRRRPPRRCVRHRGGRSIAHVPGHGDDDHARATHVVVRPEVAARPVPPRGPRRGRQRRGGSCGGSSNDGPGRASRSPRPARPWPQPSPERSSTRPDPRTGSWWGPWRSAVSSCRERCSSTPTEGRPASSRPRGRSAPTCSSPTPTTRMRVRRPSRRRPRSWSCSTSPVTTRATW